MLFVKLIYSPVTNGQIQDLDNSIKLDGRARGFLRALLQLQTSENLPEGRNLEV
jgi:hypothetical protein